MVAITATNSASPSLQAALLRSRVDQAQRDADQAEAQARSLRAQADEAEDQATKDRGLAGSLSTQARQLQAAANSRSAASTELPAQRQNFLAQAGTYVRAGSTSEVPAQTQDFLIRLYSATSEKFAASGNALKAIDALPVINAQGQATGRILNLSA